MCMRLIYVFVYLFILCSGVENSTLPHICTGCICQCFIENGIVVFLNGFSNVLPIPSYNLEVLHRSYVDFGVHIWARLLLNIF